MMIFTLLRVVNVKSVVNALTIVKSEILVW